ncbi:MAG TPA: hypothetical protein VD905_16220 [Flavobacteriales bacterium]|nr:hypothetical protein [Flavobacteriales bacterium]
MKRILFLIAILILAFSVQAKIKTYNFKFIYGLGSSPKSKALIYYEIIEASGKAQEDTFKYIQ